MQRFIDKPFLVDNFKWDMRVYVLVTSVEPLIAYLYDDGLARFCTEEYEEPEEDNLDNAEMHLTNFSINWESDAFIDTEADDTGSKRSLAAVFESHLGNDAHTVWQAIAQATAQTLLAFAPKLQSAYQGHFGHVRQPDLAAAGSTVQSKCFEILGFDFLLDEALGLHLLEVNSAPSLATETSLDERIKSDLLRETFSLLHLDPRAKQTQKLSSKKQLQARHDNHLKRREELLRNKREKTGVGFLSGQARDVDVSADSSAATGSSSKGSKTAIGRPPGCHAVGSPLKAVRSRREVSDTDEESSEDSEDDENSEGEESEESDGSDESSEAESQEETFVFSFSVHDGYISEGADLHQESMTVEEAKRKCAELLACAGFCHKGPPTEDVVEILFKSKWDNVTSAGNIWTSYKCDEARCMIGVGPYATSHFVQLLPNPLVPGHDAILAAASGLIVC